MFPLLLWFLESGIGPNKPAVRSGAARLITPQLPSAMRLHLSPAMRSGCRPADLEVPDAQSCSGIAEAEAGCVIIRYQMFVLAPAESLTARDTRETETQHVFAQVEFQTNSIRDH